MSSVIAGARRPEQPADNLAATSVSLSADDLRELAAVISLPPEYPGWMFGRQRDARRRQLAEASRLTPG